MCGEVGEGGTTGEDLVAGLTDQERGDIGACGGGEDPALGLLPGSLAPLLLVLDPDVGRPPHLLRRRRRRHLSILPPLAAPVASGGWFLATGYRGEEERRAAAMGTGRSSVAAGGGVES